jgi:hypothetical protein
MKKMKKIIIKWSGHKVSDSNGAQSKKITGMAHPGCCKQDGGCGKKHGR